MITKIVFKNQMVYFSLNFSCQSIAIKKQELNNIQKHLVACFVYIIVFTIKKYKL